MNLAPSKPKADTAKKITVASAFNNDSTDEEEEEMPAECRMRMRNIGRYPFYPNSQNVLFNKYNMFMFLATRPPRRDQIRSERPNKVFVIPKKCLKRTWKNPTPSSEAHPVWRLS